MKLNLGCGQKVLLGWENVDYFYEDERVRKVDLNLYPLPYKNNSVEKVKCEFTLCYLDEPIYFMYELHRICKNGAEIYISDTHFSMCFAHAELRHKRAGISYFTFGRDFWNDELDDYFELIEKKIWFTRSNFKFMNYIVNPIINTFPMFYERFLCYILPSSYVEFKLKVVK